MQNSDTVKYFIHANLTADGVVERSDVVGAIFGQTEGLLGDELDLRDLQRSSKISRMEVNVESKNGQSYGTITLGSSLDKVKTAILAASLETIERIGPCTAEIEVEMVEDIRAAKRKQIVERSKYILTELFDEGGIDTEEIIDEVRKAVRTEGIQRYAGLPAGPNVEKSDAVLIVEGRADVLNLLKYGIKNAIGVEGTNIPDEIVRLSEEKTVTAFLDSDRGGDLILKELDQVGDVDYVAHPPEGKCVEDMSHDEIRESLRNKVPLELAVDSEEENRSYDSEGSCKTETAEGSDERESESESETDGESPLRDRIEAVKGNGKSLLLDSEFDEVEEVDSEALGEKLDETNGEVENVVVDGEITQATLDSASLNGVETVAGEEIGHVVKKPLDVNVVTEAEL
ncbi:MAG: DNA primase DnaG [Halobacteria archaeon]|nr:DNA primase DnaG [Halobacteria archaeon]